MELVAEAEKLFRENPPKNRLTDVYIRHVELVRKYAVILAHEYGADVEVVEVAALLHDIGADAGRVHAQKSAEIAEEFLKEKGVPEEKVKKIAEVISLHSCHKDEPGFKEEVDLESQILRHADAIGFLEDTYMAYFEMKSDEQSKEERRAKSLKKIKAMLDKTKTEKGKELAMRFYGPAKEYIDNQ